MRTPSFRHALTSVLAVTLLSPLVTSCNKEEPTIGVVLVRTADGLPVAGATVKLFADPALPIGDPSRLDKEVVTDAGGRAEAILPASVKRPPAVVDSLLFPFREETPKASVWFGSREVPE